MIGNAYRITAKDAVGQEMRFAVFSRFRALELAKSLENKKFRDITIKIGTEIYQPPFEESLP
jgi:hypothetical protein